MIFNFGNPAVLYASQDLHLAVDKCLVLGPIKRAFDYALAPQSKILVVSFKDDAFYRFFGNAPLTDSLPLHPDALVGENCFTALWHALQKLDKVDQQVDYILQFSKPYLSPRNSIAEQLSDFKVPYLNPIKAIASDSGQSERSIQLHQKKIFGYSIKEVNRYKRFLKAIEMIEILSAKSSKFDWFSIISECGYYDQSQLIKDFRYYLSLSPTQYLKFQQDICNPVH